MVSQCARPSGQFKLRELLERSVPVAHMPRVRVYDVAISLGAHADEYVYFAASLFWRTSARVWHEDGPRERFSLGNNFPRNGRLFVHVCTEMQ